ncbi:MAG: DUF5906 domain-containing protein [Hyphomicrobium sp.]|uniref:primase-helicase family protein n=1 Tax=Hyphomicrobium sp. TaxID=82 RepID=UPI001321A94A|nr:primase-helicase family protein [Hyphomicrobium sp.]KAB2942290.1 MAG: hypothetical protein F9K20_07070 [Hyphomicrobium sp.]MBZ0208434.1 DUF5906 domain-containing protein [Hyphomicrobium sp.]
MSSQANTKNVFTLPEVGGFVVPFGQMDTALKQMNERWAVVKIGGKTRYMVLRHDAQSEFVDKQGLNNLFENAYYEDMTKRGEIVIRRFLPRWLGWTERRQYNGYGFFPAPEGHPLACPEGYYNAHQGFAVEPKKGSWKLLLGHIYRNVCRGDADRFRWLIAWLAQLAQQPHIKPGTHVVLKGAEGTGKSKLGEWMIRLLAPSAMPITSGERITGRFNAHLESLLFALIEETFWAGDKRAEGVLKSLATAEEFDYERKGLDPYAGRNYLRLMLASNEDWVVPAGSGGRRWFVLEVGNGREQDHAFFKALDEEMEDGGLAAMLYDLLRHDFSKVNLRRAPLTEWLVEQRLHSYDTRRRWWRDVLVSGEFRPDDDTTPVRLNASSETIVRKDDVFKGARRHFGNDRRPASPSEIGTFLVRTLGVSVREGPRLREHDGERSRTYVFPPLHEMRQAWAEATGDVIDDPLDGADEQTVEPEAATCVVPMHGYRGRGSSNGRSASA